jgi:hypothetical protein
MLGVAIAQTVTPQTPTTDPSVNVGGQGSPQATIDKGPAASSNSTSMAAADTSSNSSSASTTNDASSNTVAKADRG